MTTPTAKPKSPSSDIKSPISALAGGMAGMSKSQSFEFESAPPTASLDVEVDAQEMEKVLKTPPVEARTDPAWKAYVDIGYITQQDVNVWTEFMGCAPDDLENHLAERGSHIVQAFLKMLSTIQSAEARKYILSVLDQCCITNKRRWGALFNSHLKPKSDLPAVLSVKEKEKEKEMNSALYSKNEKTAAAAKPAPAASGVKIEEKRISPYTPFFNILRQETLDQYTQARVLHILATFFVYGGTIPKPGSNKTGAQVAAESDEIKEFLRYLIAKLGTAKGRELLTVLMTTKEVLKNPDVRRLFVEFGGLKALDQYFRHEHDTRNTQFTYVACFCVWLLTYNKDLHPELRAWTVVTRTNKIITATNREKVLRLGFAILANCANRENFNEEMIAAGMIKFIDALGGRKIKDEDLLKDIDELRKTLEEAMHALSSFEKYASEVDSGELRWSPVHVEQFWRENSNKFEEKSFEYIKKVIALLDANNELSVTVACSDLGEFARFHPDGKRVITQYGGKTKLMSLMAQKSQPAKVTSAALLAVQKLMVTNWEHLAPGGGKNKKQDE